MRWKGYQCRVDAGVDPATLFARRVSEQAVLRVRRRFESQRAFDFLANTEEAVCVIDDRQRIVLWNAGAGDLLGFEPRDVLDRCCFDVLRAQDATGTAVCRRCCGPRLAVAAGKLVPSYDLHVMTKNNGRLRVKAATIVLPSRWVAHLLYPANENRGT
jgi:PAS domain-containing protein